MTKGSHPGLLLDLHDSLSDQLIKSGLEPGKASDIAYTVTEHIHKTWAGQQLYVPKSVELKCATRNQDIYRRFNGKNFTELSREYGLTEMRIRQIIKEQREKRASA